MNAAAAATAAKDAWLQSTKITMSVSKINPKTLDKQLRSAAATPAPEKTKRTSTATTNVTLAPLLGSSFGVLLRLFQMLVLVIGRVEEIAYLGLL